MPEAAPQERRPPLTRGSLLDEGVYAIAALRFRNGRITNMDILRDDERLARLELTIPELSDG